MLHEAPYTQQPLSAKPEHEYWLTSSQEPSVGGLTFMQAAQSSSPRQAYSSVVHCGSPLSLAVLPGGPRAARAIVDVIHVSEVDGVRLRTGFERRFMYVCGISCLVGLSAATTPCNPARYISGNHAEC